VSGALFALVMIVWTGPETSDLYVLDHDLTYSDCQQEIAVNHNHDLLVCSELDTD
jgi:hypothetical protein